MLQTIFDLLIQRKTTTSSPKQNGVLNGEPSTSKASNISENKGKENKEQIHYQDDSDEHMDNGEKKRKGEEVRLWNSL